VQRANRPAIASLGFCGIDQIGEVSDQILGTGRSAERLRLLQIDSAWGRAVGPHLRAAASPTGCHAGGLLVEVRDATWKRELEHLKPEILRRLRSLLPSRQIVDISFRVRGAARGAPAVPAAPTPVHPPGGETLRDRSADLAIEMSVPLQRVPDRELRDRLSRVMGRYLAGVR